jgi:hypothetical protein
MVLQAFQEMEKIKILTMERRHFFYIEKTIFRAIFTAKHRLPYNSDGKGDKKG